MERQAHRNVDVMTYALREPLSWGSGMLVLHQERENRVQEGRAVDEDLLETARRAAAQGALSILPQFDESAKQAGMTT
jgi:hypothetical protein